MFFYASGFTGDEHFQTFETVFLTRGSLVTVVFPFSDRSFVPWGLLAMNFFGPRGLAFRASGFATDGGTDFAELPGAVAVGHF